MFRVLLPEKEMRKFIITFVLLTVLLGCSTTSSNEDLSPSEIKFEKDSSFCDAYTEYSVITHPNYIKCMKDRGWNLQE